MSDFRRRLMQCSNKYIELEYIESTGTQFIDTGEIANQDTGIDMKYKVTKFQSNLSSGLSPFGARKSYLKDQFLILSPVNAYTHVYFCYGNEEKINTSISLDKDINVNIRGNIWKTSLFNYSFSNANFVTPYNLSLFAINSRLSEGFDGGLRIYFAKIYNKNELIKDLIPVIRKIDNDVCMYDKISGKFFTNQGTGKFIAGPEKI